MAKSLNTVRALLEARNFDGARRLVEKALDDNPDDLVAWGLRIEIETDAGQPKRALELCQQILARYPNSASLRLDEFYALVATKDKKQAAEAFERFKQDFPHFAFHFDEMELLLDAANDRINKIGKKFRDASSDVTIPAEMREMGIVHHKINDVFTAQRLLLEAHSSFANDHQLNAALATNSFQLGRPATTRKYARLALAAEPTDQRMRFLICASYLQYLPPFYIICMVVMLYLLSLTVLHKHVGLVVFAVVYYFILDAIRIWYDVFSIFSGLPVYKFSIVLNVSFFIFSVFVIDGNLFKKVFKHRRVKLKDY